MVVVQPTAPVYDGNAGHDLGDLDTTMGYVYVSTAVLMSVTAFSLNTAMGSTLEVEDFQRQSNTLGGTLAGALLQYLMFPAEAFLVSHLMGLPGPYSIGMSLVASCPGSALTALVTFHINGDVCMSFCLTAVNTAVSFGLAQAMLYLYSRSWTYETLHIALWPLIVTLMLQTISPIIGYFIKTRSALVAWYIEKIGTVIGLMSFTTNCIIKLVANHEDIVLTPWGVVVAILLLPSLGWVSAYLLAWLFHQNIWKRRTICVEVLLHNVSLATLILGTTFHDFTAKHEVAALMSLFNPINGLYSILVVTVYNLRPPWTKSGSGGMQRTGELQDLPPVENLSRSVSGEEMTHANVQISNSGTRETKDDPPLPMVWGPLAISASGSYDSPDAKMTPRLKLKSQRAVKKPDSSLAIVHGPIKVSVI